MLLKPYGYTVRETRLFATFSNGGVGGGVGSTLKGINICSLGAIVGPGPKTYRENCLLNHIQACGKVFIINYAK